MDSKTIKDILKEVRALEELSKASAKKLDDTVGQLESIYRLVFEVNAKVDYYIATSSLNKESEASEQKKKSKTPIPNIMVYFRNTYRDEKRRHIFDAIFTQEEADAIVASNTTKDHDAATILYNTLFRGNKANTQKLKSIRENENSEISNDNYSELLRSEQ